MFLKELIEEHYENSTLYQRKSLVFLRFLSQVLKMVEPEFPSFNNDEVDLELFISTSEPIIQEIRDLFDNYWEISKTYERLLNKNGELR